MSSAYESNIQPIFILAVIWKLRFAMGCSPLKTFYWKQQIFSVNGIFPIFKERYQLSLLGAPALQGAQSVECWSFAHRLLEKGSNDHRVVKSQDSRII